MTEIKFDTIDYPKLKFAHKQIVSQIKELKQLLSKPHDMATAPEAQFRMISLAYYSNLYCTVVAHMRGKIHNRYKYKSIEEQLDFLNNNSSILVDFFK